MNKERSDYLAPWEEDWEIPQSDEPEFVLDTPEYWDDYRKAVMDLANQILCGARLPKEESK